MMHPQDYRGREVVVLGLARSGVAVAKLFHKFGASVMVNDKKERAACPEASELEDRGISVLCGGHPETLVHPGVALLVKNPGIPYRIGPIQDALRLGIEVVSEVEVAGKISRAPIIGITGSNGKTTTTTWVGRMLESAGLSPIVAGNIGRPLCEAAEEAEEDQWLVAELSSFQLKGTSEFRPRIGCLLNVYETHLDYHGGMDDYIASKAKLFAGMGPGDTAVLNADDPVCRSIAQTLQGPELLPFSLKSDLPYGVHLSSRDLSRWKEASVVYTDREGRRHELAAAGEIGLPGLFNVENALAAAAVALAAGVPLSDVGEALRAFRGVEHRLEFVREMDGVAFYNNSKATNPAATVVALEALEDGIVLIAGGLERGMDYLDLVPHLRRRVKAVVSLGETRQKINLAAQEAGINRVKTVDTATSGRNAVDEAVRAAYAFAEPGDKVLLSPACASWDMFPSYEERGRMFKESVHNL